MWGPRGGSGDRPGISRAETDHSAPSQAHSSRGLTPGLSAAVPKPGSGLVHSSSHFFQVGEKFTFQEHFLVERQIPRCACNPSEHTEPSSGHLGHL